MKSLNLLIRALLLVALSVTSINTTFGDGERGLGGTGKQDDTLVAALYEGERGLGGTGVIGTITAFGSIWVNGIEIEYDDNTDIRMDGTPTTQRQLRLGQQVQVRVEQRNQQVFATSVAINHEVVAPIESINTRERMMTVLGQQVIWATNAPGNWRSYKSGDMVAVSGYRNDSGVILATDVTAAPHSEHWLLRGTVQLRQNRYYIGDLPLADDVARSYSGERVIAEGSLRRGKPIDVKLRKVSGIPFDGNVERVLLEGHWQDSSHFRYADGLLDSKSIIDSGTQFYGDKLYLFLSPDQESLQQMPVRNQRHDSIPAAPARPQSRTNDRANRADITRPQRP